MIYALRRLAVIPRLGPENIRHECLRIAVVERKPARLDLHHDAMARQEDVIRRGQGEAIEQRLVGGDGLGGFEALAIAAAENVGRDHQLIAAHVGLAGHFVGIDIDQL